MMIDTGAARNLIKQKVLKLEVPINSQNVLKLTAINVLTLYTLGQVKMNIFDYPTLIPALIQFCRPFQMFKSSRFLKKYWKKNCYFFNYILRKFQIVICFAPLLHGVERNTILHFDWNSKTDSMKSIKRPEDAIFTTRERGEWGQVGGVVRMWERQGRNKSSAPRRLSLLASHGYGVQSRL